MKIDIVRGEDWEVLYIDGLKIIEGHRLTAGEIFLALHDLAPTDFDGPTVHACSHLDLDDFPAELKDLYS